MKTSIPKLCPHCFYYPQGNLTLGVCCLNCGKDTRIEPKFEESVERIIDLKKQKDDLKSEYQSLEYELFSVKNDIKERKKNIKLTFILIAMVMLPAVIYLAGTGLGIMKKVV